MNRLVVLKLLPDGSAGNPERRERFEHEAHAVAALTHPSIVTIYSVQQVDGQFFLTMEFISILYSQCDQCTADLMLVAGFR